MQKPQKDLLRTLVAGLRHTLLGRYDDAGVFYPGDLDRELERLGVGRDGRITPLDALPYATFYERRAHRVAEAQLVDVPGTQRPVLRQEIVERAAYTWINRLLALRAMEARGLIDETLRPNPAYDGIPEALFILRHTAPQRTSGADAGWWAVIEDACRVQARCLPGLFDLDDPNAALRPSTMALVRCVGVVGGADKEASRQGAEGNGLDGVFRDPDAIGWAYQFYQEEAKARVYAKLGRGGKVETRGEIAAVTQLFTEPYMAQWLLQNSLGRSYHEIYPDSHLPETWEYYILRKDAEVAQGPETPDSSFITHHSSLANLTFMDPCMGSGHLEREGFDMLAAMYREQQPEMDATAIADRILSHHLHGIDIDPRAAQLAGLTLYLRAWELVRDERRQRGLAGPGEYRPPRLNFATTPTHLTPGALTRHLQRHREDRPFEPLLRGVFEALEQAPILGSLLKPGEHLDQAIRAFRKQSAGGQYGLLDEHGDLNRLLEELGKHDPEALKRLMLERIGRSFAAEAGDAGDVGEALFGREATEGVRLLQLLDSKYALVATNPPYMGSGNMGEFLAEYLKVNYLPGKRDLYAAFMLRCLGLCKPSARVAMVTQQSWLFLKGFADLRAMPEKSVRESRHSGTFAGVIRDNRVECLAHLGPNAFQEIGGEVVQTALVVLNTITPDGSHRIKSFRLVGLNSSREKDLALRTDATQTFSKLYTTPIQTKFLELPKAPVCYWLNDKFFGLLSGPTLSDIGEVKQGLATADDPHFVRFFWETRPNTRRWFPYYKGGGYRKWDGFRYYVVDWQYSGGRVKARINPKSGLPYSNVWMLARAERDLFMRIGLTASLMAQGSFAVRLMNMEGIFSSASPCFFSDEAYLMPSAGLLNSRVTSYLLRALSPELKFREGYVSRAPVLTRPPSLLGELAKACILLKQWLVGTDITQDSFGGLFFVATSRHGSRDEWSGSEAIASVLHTLEGVVERIAFSAFEITGHDIQVVLDETGFPSGWYPLLAGYAIVPELTTDLDLSLLPREVLDYLTEHERVHPDAAELARIKTNLRALYEAGPGIKTEDVDLEELEHQGDEDEVVSGAYIPIPTETFLEELSVKLQVHPISVYWLLEELRAEGVRCKPEERRLLEDRLSVLVLRLLGHRWPRQLEAGEPAPSWADRDGIIPLTPGAGESTVAERLRERLRAEDGPLGAQRAEALLEELTGQSLDRWLRKTFFDRHTKQFKRRPVAWQLASTPLPASPLRGGRRQMGKQAPAFECLLYYHACGGDMLARIRTQYVEPLVFQERRKVDSARRSGDETAAALATARIHELEDFAGRLRQVEENGFACAELDALLAEEPLDRWSGDGVFGPVNRDELLSNERAWRVDINDGVRVNVSPLQKAGLLAGDVLNKKDLDKAIADRARWRSDERRWVRAGKLPRCGWMDNNVPESPAWTELAPEREAERVRLEEKRKTVLGQTSAR